MGFWGPNGHDGVWHIALTRSLADGTWQIPIFAGELIKNYHIGFDLLLAIIHKFTLIPIQILYWNTSSIFAVGIGLVVYFFILSWRRSKNAAFWATFFVYFGGGWGWIIDLFKNGRFGGESVFWSQQSVSTLINPPFALSLIIVFLGLWFLKLGLKSKDKKYFILATFLFGVLIQVKVYAGILVLVGLLSAGIWKIINRSGISVAKVFSGTLILFILIFSFVKT
jgi:hypothetical protein